VNGLREKRRLAIASAGDDRDKPPAKAAPDLRDECLARHPGGRDSWRQEARSKNSGQT
jgi:hypothetical protein